MPPPIRIGRRFNGPPQSANGGYTCGLVAGLLGARAAEVSLRRPPPLERPLEVARAGDGLRLEQEGGEVVAEGRPLDELALEVPVGVSPMVADEAESRFPWFEGHPFPTCFVCGPERKRGDGLRIFAGSLPDGTAYASAWRPSPEWADESGAVRPEIVWAALDCPSAVGAAATAPGDATVAVLGRLSASLDAPLLVGREHAVLAWPVGREGRKRSSASAVVDADGAVLARARAIWIELRD